MLAIMTNSLEGLGSLATEAIDTRYSDIDNLTTLELCNLLNESDQGVPVAVSRSIPSISKAIDEISQRMSKGGRLFYVGAGTSGRLGVLDASECIPTFSIDDGVVVALIAGGDAALRKGIEGAEDLREGTHQEFSKLKLSENDSVVGIAASGRTPYVIGALEYASKVGSLTISISCNKNSEMSKFAKHPIEIETGPEVLAGSTRLKAGTAQKLVLNMISTVTMVNLGKTFGNLMVDLQVSNVKLRDRAIRIIQSATDCDELTARRVLEDSQNQVKVAIVMLLLDLSSEEASIALNKANSKVREVIRNAKGK